MQRVSPLALFTAIGLLGLIGSIGIALWALIAPLTPNFVAIASDVINYPSSLSALASSIRITLLAQVGSVFIAIVLLRAISVYGFNIPRSLAFYLAMPHVALAIGFAFLFSPSGWILRIISPLLTGFERPPDWLIIHDPHGISMAIVLIIKETPYLFFMGLVALKHLDVAAFYQQGISLGYTRSATFRYVVLPQLLLLMRLPMLAVLIYSVSVLDIALVVGPQRPVVFSVLMYQWFFDVAPGSNALALMAALMLLATSALLIGLWLFIVAVINAMLIKLPKKSATHTSYESAIAKAAYKAFFFLYYGAIVALLLFSLARGWRFPDALPPILSLDGWQRLNASSAIIDSLMTAFIAGALAVFCTLITLEFQIQRGLYFPNWLMCIMLLLPQITVLFGLYVVATWAGIEVGWPLTLFGHAIFIFPYAYVTLNDAYRRFDQQLYQAGLMLGRSPWMTWWIVKWPLVNTSVISAFAVAMSSSILQYLPTQILGGGRVESVTVHAVSAASGFDRGIAAQWSIVQILIGALGFSIAIALQRRQHQETLESHSFV